MEWYQVQHDDDCAREDARGSGASDCTADDEGNGIGGRATYDGTQLKNANGGQEDPFRVVECVHPAHDELERACSEHVGAGVPSNVVEGVEVVRDGRNSGCDDGAILCLISQNPVMLVEVQVEKEVTYQRDEEEGEVEGDDTGDELLEGRVFRLCF